MKILNLPIAAILLAMLATPAVLADDSIRADIAKNFSDASSATINGNGNAHQALIETPLDIALTLERARG